MNTNRLLQILPLNEKTHLLYSKHKTFHDGDSGVDLFCPETVVVKGGETQFIPLGIKAAAFEADGSNVSFLIMPRSSIAKTPLRLANSVGLIDAGYRGELLLCLDNIRCADYTIEGGTRLVQAVLFQGTPFSIKIVSELNETSRGECGWGSTTT